MFKVKFGMFLAVASLALLLAACGDSATPVQSQSAAIESPGAENPTTATQSVALAKETTLKVGAVFFLRPPAPPAGGLYALKYGLGETLFKLGKDFTTEPWLAVGAELLDDGSWEIALRQDVKFHNGAVMDAEKVKSSLDLALLRRPGTRALLDIDRIEVKDPATVTIVTNAPNPTLPGLLTNQNTSIADPDTVPASIEESASGAAMTGPYKLVSFSADQSMTVEAHTEYWQGPPASDRVEYVAFTESNTRLIALQSGDVDISINLSPQGAAVVEKDASL